MRQVFEGGPRSGNSVQGLRETVRTLSHGQRISVPRDGSDAERRRFLVPAAAAGGEVVRGAGARGAGRGAVARDLRETVRTLSVAYNLGPWRITNDATTVSAAFDGLASRWSRPYVVCARGGWGAH